MMRVDLRTCTLFSAAIGLLGWMAWAMFMPLSPTTRRFIALSAVYECTGERTTLKSTREAKVSIDLMRTCLDPNVTSFPVDSRFYSDLQRSRGLAISNLVEGLEAYSGLQHGTNVEAWILWLAARSAAENEKVEPEIPH